MAKKSKMQLVKIQQFLSYEFDKKSLLTATTGVGGEVLYQAFGLNMPKGQQVVKKRLLK